MTTPYTTGSITLTNGSAVITGAGTNWQVALIAGGTVYVDADGNALPILSVDSDIKITAAVKWRGATGTYAYAIMRDTAYGQQSVTNANALSTYLQRLDNASLAALASIATGLAAGKVPRGLSANAMEWFTVSDFIKTLLDDGDDAAARATLGAQSVLGFAPVQQGGGVGQANNKVYLGRRTADSRIGVTVDTSDLGYLWSSGLVSFSGGVTGYIAFPNGLKLQWGYDGSGSDATVAFPLAFTSFARVMAQLEWTATASQLFSSTITGITTTNFVLRKRFVEGAVVNAINSGTAWFAIGV